MTGLTDEQLHVFECVKGGQNIYLRGAAGTGKSYTIRCLKEWAYENNINIGITAMTGCAALLIDGSTLHSFLGIGLADKTAEELAHFTKTKRKNLIKTMKEVRYLVIDEVSMLDKRLFEKISEYLSIIRGNANPFGNIKLILCGDFCQLPPVNGSYCFTSDLWKELHLEECVLTKSFRQHKDETFQKLLENLRKGKMTLETCKILESLKDTTFYQGIKPTKLYPLCSNIDDINAHYLNKFIQKGNQQHTYVPLVSESAKRDSKWIYKQNIPEKNQLCVGCQIYITHNVSFDSQIVNGTRGVITKLSENAVTILRTDGTTCTIAPYTIEHDEIKAITITFMPIKLAFALTIHKSQGMTLDAIQIDLGENIFEYGQAYTAISRAKDLQSIKVVSFDPKAFKTHRDVKKFYGYIV